MGTPTVITKEYLDTVLLEVQSRVRTGKGVRRDEYGGLHIVIDESRKVAAMVSASVWAKENGVHVTSKM